jgi:hypothetical protein
MLAARVEPKNAPQESEKPTISNRWFSGNFRLALTLPRTKRARQEDNSGLHGNCTRAYWLDVVGRPGGVDQFGESARHRSLGGGMLDMRLAAGKPWMKRRVLKRRPERLQPMLLGPMSGLI